MLESGWEAVRVVGTTTDGRQVVAGLYILYETHGIPLDVIIGGCSERGVVPSWSHMVGEAAAAGMSKARAISKVRQAVSDAGHPQAALISEALEKLID